MSAPRHHYERDLFFWFGHRMYRLRWPIVAIWAVLVLASIPLVPGAASSLSPGGFSTPRLEAQQAATEIQANLGENPSTLLVIFSHPTLSTSDPAY
ncbi:MAG: hypothetical protein AB7P40_13825, partial [Chloroflexota bacterium]